MKKLHKLEINSEKIINNRELLSLRGGYGACTCTCYTNFDPICCYGYLLSETGNCPKDCHDVFGAFATGQCGNVYPCPASEQV
jgi:natural product precursor